MRDRRALEVSEEAALKAYSERAEVGGKEADCLTAAAAAYSALHSELSADEALRSVSRFVRTLGREWHGTFVRLDRDKEWSR
jgi:hypothetical protein